MNEGPTFVLIQASGILSIRFRYLNQTIQNPDLLAEKCVSEHSFACRTTLFSITKQWRRDLSFLLLAKILGENYKVAMLLSCIKGKYD